MTTKSITELADQLDDALVAYNRADHRSIAAYHSKDEQKDADYSAEMLRIGKVETALFRKICATEARTTHEAITQAIVAAHLVQLVAEGRGRKYAKKAHEALLSAISVLIDQPERTPIGKDLRRQYFDMPAKRSKIAGGAK